MMKNHTIKSFLLITSRRITKDEWKVLQMEMADFNENYMFYIADATEANGISWHLVIFIKNQRKAIFNQVEFQGNVIKINLVTIVVP